MLLRRCAACPPSGSRRATAHRSVRFVKIRVSDFCPPYDSARAGRALSRLLQRVASDVGGSATDAGELLNLTALEFGGAPGVQVLDELLVRLAQIEAVSVRNGTG